MGWNVTQIGTQLGMAVWTFFWATGLAAMTSVPSDLQVNYLTIVRDSQKLELRIGVQSPQGEPRGDVLYIHGFGDRLDNHEPLFSAWNQAGLRVISFDLPSHGENRGDLNNLNKFDFQALFDLVTQVELATKSLDTHRPLILAGWSMGGLLVVRALQEGWNAGLSRQVSGAILITPGIGVRKFPWTFGNRAGSITEDTLTHNPHPPHKAKPQPSSPFWSKLVLGFSPTLVLNSFAAQYAGYPIDVPTVMFVGGDKEDMYAKTQVLKDWAKEKQSVTLIQCPRARHEMDNEPIEYGGAEVRTSSARFAKFVLENRPIEAANFDDLSACHLIRNEVVTALAP